MMMIDSQYEVIVVTLKIGAMDSCYDPELLAGNIKRMNDFFQPGIIHLLHSIYR